MCIRDSYKTYKDTFIFLLIQYILVFCKLLEDWSIDLSHFRRAKVPQTCWDLTADLYYSPLIVFYPPEVVAASVLYIALQLKTVRVIEEKEGKRWFEVCHVSIYTIYFH